MTPEFWLAVGQIIMIDILLGGDNAVVIALACRKLPEAQRRAGIMWGTAGAIGLRVVLIFFALTLLALPYLKLVGAALLLWIGIKLLLPEDEGDHDIQASDKLWAAVKTVIVADFVMSLDNVIAIAAAAQGAHSDHHMALVIFGLVVSIPIIVWGSQLVIKLMDRFPVIITLGGMLLGWIAGQMVITDPVLKGWMATHSPYLPYAASLPSWWYSLRFSPGTKREISPDTGRRTLSRCSSSASGSRRSSRTPMTWRTARAALSEPSTASSTRCSRLRRGAAATRAAAGRAARARAASHLPTSSTNSAPAAEAR